MLEASQPYWERLKGVRLVQDESQSVKASVFTRADKLMIVLANLASRAADVHGVLSDGLPAKAHPGYQLRDCVATRGVALTPATTRQGGKLSGRRCRLSVLGHGSALLLGEARKPAAQRP